MKGSTDSRRFSSSTEHFNLLHHRLPLLPSLIFSLQHAVNQCGLSVREVSTRSLKLKKGNLSIGRIAIPEAKSVWTKLRSDAAVIFMTPSDK